MKRKDQSIGFRIPGEIKDALVQIARREGRSLAQVCEALLRGGIQTYKREGARYLQRFLERPRQEWLLACISGKSYSVDNLSIVAMGRNKRFSVRGQDIKSKCSLKLLAVSSFASTITAAEGNVLALC